jgi:uncharacterized protein (DUF1499 family)
MPSPLSAAFGLLLSLLTFWQGVPPADASLFHFEGPVPPELGVQAGQLAPCGSPAHCSRADWPVNDPQAALSLLMPVVLNMEGVEVVETGGGYLHATATSRIFGFVDDLELYADEKAGVLQARSVSRLGDSDLGVNAQRLERIREALESLD